MRNSTIFGIVALFILLSVSVSYFVQKDACMDGEMVVVAILEEHTKSGKDLVYFVDGCGNERSSILGEHDYQIGDIITLSKHD